MKIILALLAAIMSIGSNSFATDPTIVPVWPQSAPAWDAPSEAERDTTGDDGRNVAGKPVVRLGYVSTPQLHIYRPTANDTQTAIVICPGGGYSILAWDLEGTEIAQWLQSIGVTGIVLKYRVPTRESEKPWLAPVQDIQRAISMVRAGKADGITPSRVGVLGFSAGGNAATRAALATERLYEPIDASERTSQQKSFIPDFAVLVYPAWLVEKDDPKQLIDDLSVTANSPPMFFAHAFDDRISPSSSVALFSELKKNNVNASLHVFGSGGHGFGGRLAGSPTDAWKELCQSWLADRGWLAP